MTLFEAMRKADAGDHLVNKKLGADIEWTETIWCIPQKFYNLNFKYWRIQRKK